MLGAAAAYNWLISLPVLLNSGIAANDKVSAVLVAAFGVLYAIVASNPARLAPARVSPSMRANSWVRGPGTAATVLFAVGLLGASFLGLGVVPLTSAYSTCEAFEIGRAHV